jgi:hypothetical protein
MSTWIWIIQVGFITHFQYFSHFIHYIFLLYSWFVLHKSRENDKNDTVIPCHVKYFQFQVGFVPLNYDDE